MRIPFAILPLLFAAGCGGFGFGGGDSTSPRPADSMLVSTCTDAAAGRLGVARHDVLVIAELDGDVGETLGGQAALADGTVATFSCRFDRSGRLVGIDRTS